MDCQEPLQVLRKELLRRGLPPGYVERVTGELADHADDLAAETGGGAPTAATSARLPHLAARLGDPVRLADGIARAFQRRTFLGRHPWLTFVAFPAAALIAAWFATLFIMELLVVLLLAMGGETPSDAWRWVAAIASCAMAYGLTYGMPLLLCWWALRKARQTARAWSWAWAATTVLVLASFVFRIYIFRTEDGRFGIDAPLILRWGISYLFYGETLPPDLTLWRLLRTDGFSFGYGAPAAVLIGVTAFTIRQSRRALATLAATEAIEHAERA